MAWLNASWLIGTLDIATPGAIALGLTLAVLERLGR